MDTSNRKTEQIRKYSSTCHAYHRPLGIFARPERLTKKAQPQGFPSDKTPGFPKPAKGKGMVISNALKAPARYISTFSHRIVLNEENPGTQPIIFSDMKSLTYILALFILHVAISVVNAACPHPSFLTKHACSSCKTEKDALNFSKTQVRRQIFFFRLRSSFIFSFRFATHSKRITIFTFSLPEPDED